jgi:hypothetical protein
VVDGRRDDALLEIDRGLHQPSPCSDDHGIAGAQMFLDAVHGGAHALGDGLVLEMDTVDAGVALGALHLAIDQVIVGGVGRKPPPPQPVRGVGQELRSTRGASEWLSIHAGPSDASL